MQVLDAIPDDWKIFLKGNGEHTTNDSNSSASFHKVWINNRLARFSLVGGLRGSPHELYAPHKAKNCPPIFVDHDKKFFRYF